MIRVCFMKFQKVNKNIKLEKGNETKIGCLYSPDQLASTVWVTTSWGSFVLFCLKHGQARYNFLEVTNS